MWKHPKKRKGITMENMTKTPDSCILNGVPKLHWGMKAEGQVGFSFFPQCLHTVLEYVGQPISYAEIAAFSGASFRLRWFEGGWAFWANDLRLTYGHDRLHPFKLALEGVGRKYTISEDFKSIVKPDAMALIKTEIDSGRPLIALGVVGPPEPCIITGYKNNGETLVGWSFFQDDKSEYFTADNWWSEGIIAIGEKTDSTRTIKQVLANGLQLMTQDVLYPYKSDKDEGETWYGGQAAYEAWAKAMEDDNLTKSNSSMGEPTGMLQGRSDAAVYLNTIAEKLPFAKSDLTECAKLLAAAGECAAKIKELWSGDNAVEKEVRVKIAALIRQAAQHEKAACAVLEGIIGKI